MFLSHEDQRPFFGGTYFPKEQRQGMLAFTDILKRVAEYYSGHQDELRQQNEQFMQAFDELVPPAVEGQPINADPLHCGPASAGPQLRQQLRRIRQRAEIPQPKALERLLRHWYSTAAKPDARPAGAVAWPPSRSPAWARAACTTRSAGGFCRYSTDSHWMIPHFEKMLYDNAALMAVYAEAADRDGRHVLRADRGRNG